MKTDVPPGLKAFTEPQSKLVFTRSNGAEEWKPDVDPSVVSEECTLALFTNVLGTVVVDKLIERRL
jgi:hypothetical protein